MENGRCKSGHSSLTGCPEAYACAPLRMFLGALRMTSVGMWLRFGCLGMLLSCSPTEGTESIADIAFYLLLAATVGWICWRDRVRMRRIADHLGED